MRSATQGGSGPREPLMHSDLRLTLDPGYGSSTGAPCASGCRKLAAAAHRLRRIGANDERGIPHAHRLDLRLRQAKGQHVAADLAHGLDGVREDGVAGVT